MLVEVMLKSVRVNLYFCHEVALKLVQDTLIFAWTITKIGTNVEKLIRKSVRDQSSCKQLVLKLVRVNAYFE